MYSSYMQLGNCQKHLKKYNDAIDSMQNALRLAEKGYGDESDTLKQLAAIYELC
jgi:hypothetical protein